MSSKQVVLITGASSGFGRLFAETLSRNGHTVFATMRDTAGRNAANAAELRDLARKESFVLQVLEMDVTDDRSVEQAVSTAIRHAGHIDVAINNAGYGMVGMAEAVTMEQSQRIMDTNFFGSVRVNRAVLPHMRSQHSGLLLHISSGAGRVVIPSFAFYCASKFAMEAMAEAYHYELAQQGIDSCIVEPGAYKTPVFGNIVVAADTSRTETYGAANNIPGKISAILTSSAADPQEVADAVLRIVETPAGQRQLRYRVSPVDMGVDAINDVSASVQSKMLEGFGLTADTTFVQRSAAASD